MTQQMLEGAPLPLLVRMAAPNAFAFLVQASVSIAEVTFIGRLGTVPLAALALVFPALMLMQMLANGAIGGAVASAVARALGAGDVAAAEALIWHALILALLAGSGFFVLYLALGPALLHAFGVSEAVTASALAYADVVFAGAVALWVTALAGAVHRGTGNMKLPALLMVIGAMVQVPLAGALVFGWLGLPRLEVAGAAVALVSVAAVNGAVLLIRLRCPRSEVRLKLRSFRIERRLVASILRVGAPASLSPLFTVLGVGCTNLLIGGFGVAALAGYGIVARLEFLLVPMVFGMGAAMTALVGVNAGAGRYARAEHIGWIGGACAAGLTGAVGVSLAIQPGAWLGLFTDDAATWQAGASYLRIVGPAFAFQGLGLSLYFASQGAGTVVWPVAATVLRFVVGVGGAAAAVQVFDAGLSAAYAWLAAGTVAYGAITAASVKLGAWRRAGAW